MSNDTTDYALKAEIERETGESDISILGTVELKANMLTGTNPFQWFLNGDNLNGFLGNSFDAENPQIEINGSGNLAFNTKLAAQERLYFTVDATLEADSALRWTLGSTDGLSHFRPEDSLHVFYTERSAGSTDWQNTTMNSESIHSPSPSLLDWAFYSMQVTKWCSQ